MSKSAYAYHLAIYSKLVRGSNPDGPIKQGVEARINHRSEGFPAHLVELCNPGAFFRDAPMVTSIDPRLTQGGTFSYRPTYVKGRHYGMFARIEARSEEGSARAGRRFTHCAVLFVEDRWEPGLIPWAAQMLFTTRHANCCWGGAVTERDDLRQSLHMPDISHPLDTGRPGPGGRLLDLGVTDAERFRVRGPMPDTKGTMPYCDMGHEIATFLQDSDLKVQGRWLSFALGVGATVEGHGRGYFFRADHRPSEATLPAPVTLNFSDSTPPVVTGEFANDIFNSSGALVDWSTLAQPNSRGVQRKTFFEPRNLWPDQECNLVPRLELSSPVGGIAENAQGFPEAEALTLDPSEAAIVKMMTSQDGRSPTARQSAATPPPAQRDRLRSLFVATVEPPDEPIPFEVPLYLDKRTETTGAIFTMDDVFDANRLAAIRPALEQMLSRIKILDPAAGFGTFHPTPDDERFIGAFADLASYVIAFGALGDLALISQTVQELLEHGPVRVMGIAEGGLLEEVFYSLMARFGEPAWLDWADRQQRKEQNLRIHLVKIGKIDARYEVASPSRKRIGAVMQAAQRTYCEPDLDRPGYDNDAAHHIFARLDEFIDAALAILTQRFAYTVTQ